MLHTWAMARFRLPEILRARPSAPFTFRWIVSAEFEPRDPAATVPSAIRRAGAQLESGNSWSWEVLVPWQTMVYGFIRRDVDERATIHLLQSDEVWELELQSLPIQTHTAHAAGAAGVAAMTAAVWLIGGWVGGLFPGLAMALAGGLWADVTRAMALQTLDHRLRRLVEDVGLELWPGAPAQLLPPPTGLV